MAFLSCTIFYIFAAGFLNRVQGVFLASMIDSASTTGLPILDGVTLKAFHDNGIHGEVVGFAAKEERECGIVVLDYSSYIDGRMFDQVLEPFEKSLNISSTLNEELRMRVYRTMKEDALNLHLQEMEATFNKYRRVTPHYNTGQVEFFPGIGIVAFGVGVGLGELAYREIKALIYKYSEEEHQQERLMKQVLEMKSQMHNLAEFLELKTCMIRFEFVFAQVRSRLLMAIEAALTGLFNHGRVTHRVINHHGESNLLSAIANLMGLERFNASVLKSRFDVAGDTLRATVLSMNRRVMEVKICYPVSLEKNVGYLTRIVPLGGFSENMKKYSSHVLGAHYIVPTSMLVSNVSALEEVSNVDECSTLSSTLLCKTKPQTTCGLHSSNRDGCTVVEHNSTNDEFTLIVPLLKTVVVITRMKRMFYKKQGNEAFQSLKIEKPIIVVEIPQGAELHIGSMKVASRVKTGNLTMELTIALPSNHTPTKPDNQHYEDNDRNQNFAEDDGCKSIRILARSVLQMASRLRSSARYHEVLEVGNAAKANLDRLKSEHIIRYTPEKLHEDMFYPKNPNEGANYCVVCGKQGEYRFAEHLRRAHSDVLIKNSLDYKIVMQLGRGITQYMGRAKINLNDVRRPVTEGEWGVYNDFVHQLRKCGIPTDGGYEDKRIDRYKYVRKDEVEMLVNEAVARCRVRGEIVAEAQAGIDANRSSIAERRSQANEDWIQTQLSISKKHNASNVESNASLSQIKQKTKRGLPAATSSQKLAIDVASTNTAETDRVRKDSPSSAEVSIEEISPPVLPVTFASPRVDRHLLYTCFGDEQYSGDANVADIFKMAPKKDYMFYHELDSFDPEYFEQNYTPKSEEERKLDKNLKFWRKVVRESHPLLQQFAKSIQDKLPNTSKYTGKPAKGGIWSYVQYIDRFMLVAMRSRQRMGETVTVDDAIYSSEIFLPYMERLKAEGVKLDLRRMITKAVSSFWRFLSIQLEKRAGRQRVLDLKQYKRRIAHQFRSHNEEERITMSFKGIVPQDKRQDDIMYCVTRAIVDHRGIAKSVDKIMDKFERDGTLYPAQYNYVMGALCAYIVHCNTSRNEVIYKMMYGSIYAPEMRKRPVSEFGQDIDFTGLQCIKIDWEDDEGKEGNKKKIEETLWVGCYPYPKIRASYQKTAYGGQYFVLDKKSKKWIDYYTKLRDFVIQKHELVDMKKPDAPFFLQYRGKPVEKSTVSHLMKQFLRDSGFTELHLSCNMTRHAVASRQYEDYYRREMEKLKGADEDMARMAAHSQKIQLKTYQNKYMISCAHGYVKARQLAKREEAENLDTIRRVQGMFKLANLTRRCKNVAPEIVVDELELEDSNDVSSESEEENEIADVPEEQMPGPSSRPDSVRQRSESTSDAEQSPRKRSKTSSLRKESDEKKSKTLVQKSEREPQIVTYSSDSDEIEL